jgi:hypothetical protein
LHGAAIHAHADSFRRKLVAALQAVALEELAVAWAACLQPDRVLQEELLASPQAAQQLASQSVVAEEAEAQPLALLPQQEQEVEEAQLELAQALREVAVERQPREAAVEAEARPQRARQASCAQLWLQLPWLPYPLPLFVPRQLPHRQARGNVRVPLPLRLLQSSWNAFFSR